MDNNNILTKDDCMFLLEVLAYYSNQNKFYYFLNEDLFNQVYNKLITIVNDGN